MLHAPALPVMSCARPVRHVCGKRDRARMPLRREIGAAQMRRPDLQALNSVNLPPAPYTRGAENRSTLDCVTPVTPPAYIGCNPMGERA